MPGAKEDPKKRPLEGQTEDDATTTVVEDDGEGTGSTTTEADAAAESDVYKDPEKAKKLAEKLRKEAASHRTKAKGFETQLAGLNDTVSKLKSALGIEGDDAEKPEDKVKALSSELSQSQSRAAILELAVEHGIGKDGIEYFEFLLGKKLGALPEGEELDDEAIQEIVAKVGTKAGGQGGGEGKTGLNPKKPKPTSQDDGTTPEQFAQMNTAQKSLIYAKDPATYERLKEAAQQKGLLR